MRHPGICSEGRKPNENKRAPWGPGKRGDTVSARRLKVFLTADSEVWPTGIANDRFGAADIRREFADQFAYYILGETAEGEFGIRHQMRMLDTYGLKATFFQEVLFSDIAGRQWLADIVSMIGGRGHDIQLHVHTEWLGRPEMSLALPRRVNIRGYPFHDQVSILARAASMLVEAGAPAPRAFRAGNFGANHETLTALAGVGIAIDSSYNLPYVNKACALSSAQRLTVPTRIGAIMEYPVSFYFDYLSHARPAHLIACSLRELEWALCAAWRAAWPAFVIVWHSNELLRRRRHVADTVQPNHRIVDRFEGLLHFLAANQGRFECSVFRDCDTQHAGDSIAPPPIRGNPGLTARRMFEGIFSQLPERRA